jgi:membrane protein YqaA with SNARE-associated domain
MWPYALMVVFAVPGPLLWFISTEAMVVYGVTQEGRDALLFPLCGALGQCITFTGLYLVGEKALKKVAYTRRKLEALTPEKRVRFSKGTTVGLISGSITGLPPVFVLGPLAASVHYPLWKLWIIAVAGRTLRFWLLAVGFSQVRTWLGV